MTYEKLHDVNDCEFLHDFAIVNRGSNGLLLRFLHVCEAFVHGVLDHESGDVSLILLPDTEYAAKSLLFYGRIPPKVDANDF